MTDCYCFTINNPSEKDIAAILAIDRRYNVIYGREVGKKGTPHLQGMIWNESETRLRRDRVCKWLGGRAHLEVCREFYCSLAYCCKDLCIYSSITLDLEMLTNIIKRAKELHDCNHFVGAIIANCLANPSHENMKNYLDDEFLSSIYMAHLANEAKH